MAIGWDFRQFPTIFDDAPDDIHCTSDIRYMVNLTHPFDSASPDVMETNPKRLEPGRHDTLLKPQTWALVESLAILNALHTDLSGPSPHLRYHTCIDNMTLQSICATYKFNKMISDDANGGRPVTGDTT